MRVRGLIVMVLVMGALLAGCRSPEETATNAGTSTSRPPDSVVGTLPPLTVVPPTEPPSTTTAPPKPTKVPPVTKTPTTRPPKPPPTTKFPPTTAPAPETANFCNYVKSIDLDIAGNWVEGFRALHVAVQQAQGIAPATLAQPLADMRAALDAAAPAVDAGTMSSSADLNAWIASQPPDVQQRLGASVKAVFEFARTKCPK